MLGMILIDDHEYLVNGLKQFVDWDDLGVEILDTAADGEQGLLKIRSLRPDIVLTDISMPIMDGLEMIRQLQSDSKKPQFVILTGHGEFDYAKEAIHYGVADFILKPILPAEVTTIMKTVVQRCHDEENRFARENEMRQRLHESMPILTERYMEELFEGRIFGNDVLLEKAAFLDLDIPSGPYRIICIQISNYHQAIESQPEARQQYIKFYIISQICEILGIHKTFVGFREKTAVFMTTKYGTTDEQMIDKLQIEIEDCIRRILKEFGVQMHVGVSESAVELSQISDSYKKALESLKYRAHFEQCQIIFHRDIIHSLTAETIVQFFDRSSLMDALKMRSYADMNVSLDMTLKMIHNDPALSMNHVKTIFVEMASVVISTMLQMGETPPKSIETGTCILDQTNHLDTLDELEVWMRSVILQVKEVLDKKMSQRTMRIIEQMQTIIHEEYQKEVTLQNIAKRIYLTPNYLGSIFSKTIGKSFNDYLAEYRIEKAIEILNTGEYHVYQVGEMVGYRDLDHFRKTFYDITGSSPSQFLK